MHCDSLQWMQIVELDGTIMAWYGRKNRAVLRSGPSPLESRDEHDALLADLLIIRRAPQRQSFIRGCNSHV